jgi:hypothetical protein
MSNVVHDTELLTQTVRIEGTFASGKVSVGTGFPYTFLYKRIDDKTATGFRTIVTNKHVIESKGERVKSGFFHLNKKDEFNKCTYGNTVKIEFKGKEWINHPSEDVDLSVLPIDEYVSIIRQEGTIINYVSNLCEFVPSNEQEWSRIGPLEDIISVGYPNGLWDEDNNIPISRKGLTATYPKLNYLNKEQFLVDIPIFPGISGSPIFAYSYGQEFYESGGWGVGNKCLLIGILYAKLKYKESEPGADLSVIPTNKSIPEIYELISNLGVAIKSTKLKEFDKIFEEKSNQ